MAIGGGKKKGSGGIVGGLKKLGGGAMELLGAPQQVIFGAGSALGSALQGDWRSAGHGATHGLKELLTLGQSKDNWDLAQAIGTTGKDGVRQQQKLGKGLNMAGTFLLDPTLFLGVGKAREATKGVTALAKLTGASADDVSKAIKTGQLGGQKFDLAKGGALRNMLTQDLVAGGVKAKKADKIAKLTARRGAGGVTAFVPGTEIHKTLVSGAKMGAAGKAIKATAPARLVAESGVANLAAQAFKPGHELSQGLGDKNLADKIRGSITGRQAAQTVRQDDLLHEIRNAAEMVGRPVDDVDLSEALRGLEDGARGITDLLARKPELSPLMKVLDENRHIIEAEQTGRGLLDNVHNSDTYMQRLGTDDLAKAAKKGKGAAKAHMASDAAGSLTAALKQSAGRARNIFPEMPAEGLNELKRAVDAGMTHADIVQLVKGQGFNKYVKVSDPQILDGMVDDFMRLAQDLPPGTKLYQENAVASLLNRSASAGRAIAAHDAVADIRKMTDKAGNPILLDDAAIKARLQAGQKLPSDWVTEELPYIGKIAGPEALIHELKKVVGVVGQDDFMAKFDKAMQGWTRFWKTHATTGLLGALPFATRNGRSNVYLMMTEGHQPQEIFAAMKEMKKLEDKVREVLGSSRVGNKFKGKHAQDVVSNGVDSALQSHLTPAEYDLWRTMQHEGITTRGFFDIDFGDDVFDKTNAALGRKRDVKGGMPGKAASALLSTKGTLAREGRNVNQAIETNARMAMFKLSLDKYGSFEEAAKVTKQVLFDYDELTEFERKVMKNIIPFYTFMRKNLPQQLETLVQNPVRLALPEKISESVMEPLPEDSPDYMKQDGARTIPGFVPFFGGSISTPDRPFKAAIDVFDPLLLAAQGQGSAAAREAANIPGGPAVGLLKWLTEQGTGKDSFTGGGIPSGAGSAAQRLLTNQIPSVGRLPRLGPVKELTGKKNKPLPEEVLKLLSGLRAQGQQ